jgi:hypothetical protein
MRERVRGGRTELRNNSLVRTLHVSPKVILRITISRTADATDGSSKTTIHRIKRQIGQESCKTEHVHGYRRLPTHKKTTAIAVAL